MVEKKRKIQQNEGEGNRTAARQYNKEQEKFAHSHRVEEAARKAEKAIDSTEGDALREAELVGKRHIAEEDPEVKR